MIFLTNLVVDVRPCDRAWPIAIAQVGGKVGPVPYVTAVPLPAMELKENKEVQPDGPGPKPNAKPKAKPKVRSDFPETWLWTEEKFDDKTAEKVVTVTVPDTITTWYASGFAMSDKTGLGIANPAEIIGFKEVFVSMNLPYSVIRGEVVTLPIVIFNYMPDCLHAKISMKDTKDFRSLTRSHADFCICGGQSATVMFKIIPRKLGRVEIEAQAETLSTNTCPKHVKFDSNSYIDIVRRKLLVEPEGIEKEYTYNSLVCPSEKTPVAGNVKLRIPDKVVPGSVFAELRVIGDLMGPSLSNIDNLLKMPYGCGEQNMLNFAPNIFIMQYLKATGQLTDAIKEKAEGYTLQGYQRELSYKHPDGSYSAFGERDKEGSMWLTAFVLKSFAQARPFIEIDKKVLTEAKRWIIRKQSRDGCFPTVGSLHSKSMKGGVSSPVTLTGYVVISLLEADVEPDSPHISHAITGCIKPNLKNINDSYSVAILAYAMAKAGRTDEYKFLLNKLNSLAVRESGMRHWEEPKAKEEKHSDWFYVPYHQARSADIEMTAYALLAMLPKKDKTESLAAIDIVRWLSQQRNSLGGWSSTQDTVLAMQALAQYAALVYGGDGDMTIDVSTEGLQHKFAVSNRNSLVLQRVQIPSKFPSVLKTFASGKGCALLAASVKYNVLQVQEVPAFSLSVNISPVKDNKKLSYGRCRSQKMTICAAWLRKGESNMAIIAVKMLSGFRPVIPSLDKAVKNDASLKEYEKKGNEWIFYYSKIRDVCINFRVKQANIVEGIKPASVSVYDYYDTDKAATTKYKVTAKMCK